MGSCYAKYAVDYALAQVGCSCGKTNEYSAMLDSVHYFNTKKNGYADSCSIFVNACVLIGGCVDPDFFDEPDTAKWTGLYMMYEPQDGSNAAAGCTQAAGYFKANNAWYTDPKDFERGDQIFFWKSNKAIYHTGIIVDWNDEGLKVVEGNTTYEGISGMVGLKLYPYNSDKIAGVGRPRYDGWEIVGSNGKETENNGNNKTWDEIFTDIAWDCYEGKYGNGLDRKHKVNALGYGNIFSEVQKRVNMIVAGLIKK